MKIITKKCLLTLLAVVTMTVIFCFGASAKTVPASGKCGDNVYWDYNSSTKELVISGSGAMTNYDYGDSPFYESDIKSVVIKNGVTAIGNYAFLICRSLQSVTISDSVTTIGDYSFHSCYNLESVTLPDSVASIGDSAFSSCYSFETITIPDSVTSIGSYAFSSCCNLETITIPDSVTSIGSSAFSSCDWLVVYCNKNSYTASYAANNNLGYVLIDGSDEDCILSGKADNLTWYLDKRTGLFKIESTENMIELTASNSPWYEYKNYITKLELPEECTKIGGYAFMSLYKLEQVTIPDSVTSIGSSAFSSCYNLQSVTISDSVTTIGDYSFRSCYNLESVTLPDSVTAIGDGTFWKCTGLKNITIGAGVTSIGEAAFGYCMSLTDIIVSAENTAYSSDENNILFNKDKTILVCYPSGKPQTHYTIPDSVTTIATAAISFCNNLESVTIPDSVTTIDYAAFYYSVGLKSVTIGDGVTTIGVGAFYYCTGLENLTIGSDVKTIGDDAFSSCESLKSVTIPDSVVSIGEGAFYACSSLESVTIGSGVTKINEGAFGGHCPSLTDVYYHGSQEKWNAIEIGEDNENLTGANIHYIICLHSDKTAHPQQDATCTGIGYTAGVFCSECKMWLSGHEEISAKGHIDSDDDGICDTCSAILREEPIEPDEPEQPEKKSDIFSLIAEFFRKILEFIKKIFGIK